MKKSVWDLVRKKFPRNQFALLHEVRNGAGFSADRSADGILVGLWPSMGLGIQGIELKSYRSDWLRELKDPSKSNAFFQYCRRFWVLAEAPGIVRLEEVPEQWGFMEWEGTGLKTRKEAPKLQPLKPIDDSLLAAMMKRATSNVVPVSEVDDKVQEQIDTLKARWEEQHSNTLKNLTLELEKWRLRGEEFKQILGEDFLKPERYSFSNDGKKVAEAIKLVRDNGIDNLRKQLLEIQNYADRITKSVADHLSTFKC